MAVLLLLPAALIAIPATAQTVVGAKFSIASGWAAGGGAFDGTNFLVLLQSDTSAAKVAAQLMSPGGAKIGSTIALGHDGQSCCAVGIAFDGTNYLVAWQEDQGTKNSYAPLMVYGQFVNKSGATVGQAFAMTTAGISFDGVNMLAYGGGKYLLTYTRLIVPANGASSTNRYVAGRIVSADGSMGAEFRISQGYGNGSSIGFDGTNFFVVWTENTQNYEVRGRYVSPNGTPGQEISINASPAFSDNPILVSFDGTNYLVVWPDDADSGWDVFGQRVSPSGALVGGAITITSEPGTQLAMGAAFDGTNHIVTWTDMQNDANGNGLCDAGEGTCWDVYGQYIGKDGALVGSKFAINTDPGNQIGGVGCAGGKCLALVSSGIVLGHGGPSQVGEVYGAFLTSQASPPLPSITFTASPASITAGQSSTLSWSVTNATSISIDRGIGAVGAASSASVTPSATTTYTLTATGAGGTTTKQVTVTVTPATPLPSITFTASPASITAGQSSTLSWSVVNATTVSIDNGVGLQTASGEVVVKPASTTAYTLVAMGPGGTSVASVTVTVSPGSSRRRAAAH